MSDLISREELISHLNDWAFGEAPDARHEGTEWLIKQLRYETIQECIKAVEELPSAERVGKWIDRSDGGRILYPWIESYECSECGYTGSGAWHYCPNCGVHMEG